MQKVIMDGKGTCKVKFNVGSNMYLFGVSKRREEAFPHVIISSPWDGSTKGIRIRTGRGDSPDPRFLDKNDVSGTGLKEGMGQRTLSVHIDRHNLDGVLRH